jgi:TRAP-type C4-dicarboxylate transport system permease small subunit
MYNILIKVSNLIANISGKAASVMLAFVAFILLLQVFLRYVFNAALPWPEEASRYTMIWVVLLISNVLIRDRELVNVDFFDKMWPPKVIVFRDAAYRILLLILLIVLFKEGLIQAIAEKRQTTTAMGISWFWPYLSIPVGTALMLYQMIFLIIRDIRHFKEKKSQT